jgi:hypothetical protein
VVSGRLIRRLCVGKEAQDVDPLGIRIKDARIVDLSYCMVARPLRFEATTFDMTPDLIGAQLPALWFEDCTLPGLLANGIRTGHLRLDSSRVSGEVLLISARVGGQLDCAGATLSNEGGYALPPRQPAAPHPRRAAPALPGQPAAALPHPARCGGALQPGPAARPGPRRVLRRACSGRARAAGRSRGLAGRPPGPEERLGAPPGRPQAGALRGSPRRTTSRAAWLEDLWRST